MQTEYFTRCEVCFASGSVFHPAGGETGFRVWHKAETGYTA
jgi:hypothetical protein